MNLPPRKDTATLKAEQTAERIETFLEPYRKDIHAALMDRIREEIGHEPTEEECNEHAATCVVTEANDAGIIKFYAWSGERVMKVVLDGGQLRAIKLYPEPRLFNPETDSLLLPPKDFVTQHENELEQFLQELSEYQKPHLN